MNIFQDKSLIISEDRVIGSQYKKQSLLWFIHRRPLCYINNNKKPTEHVRREFTISWNSLLSTFFSFLLVPHTIPYVSNRLILLVHAFACTRCTIFADKQLYQRRMYILSIFFLHCLCRLAIRWWHTTFVRNFNYV